MSPQHTLSGQQAIHNIAVQHKILPFFSIIPLHAWPGLKYFPWWLHVNESTLPLHSCEYGIYYIEFIMWAWSVSPHRRHAGSNCKWRTWSRSPHMMNKKQMSSTSINHKKQRLHFLGLSIRQHVASHLYCHLIFLATVYRKISFQGHVRSTEFFKYFSALAWIWTLNHQQITTYEYAKNEHKSLFQVCYWLNSPQR